MEERRLENHDVCVKYENGGRAMVGRLLLAEDGWLHIGLGKSLVRKRIAYSTVDLVSHMAMTCHACAHGEKLDA